MPESLRHQDELLDLLGDRRAREILGAVASKPRTVADLTDICSMPKSTVYRRVNEMHDRGYLVEDIRMRTDGQHPKQYELAPDIHGLEMKLSDSLKISMKFEEDDRSLDSGDTDGVRSGLRH